MIFSRNQIQNAQFDLVVKTAERWLAKV